jgi:hypothetical protein
VNMCTSSARRHFRFRGYSKNSSSTFNASNKSCVRGHGLLTQARSSATVRGPKPVHVPASVPLTGDASPPAVRLWQPKCRNLCWQPMEDDAADDVGKQGRSGTFFPLPASFTLRSPAVRRALVECQ